MQPSYARLTSSRFTGPERDAGLLDVRLPFRGERNVAAASTVRPFLPQQRELIHSSLFPKHSRKELCAYWQETEMNCRPDPLSPSYRLYASRGERRSADRWAGTGTLPHCGLLFKLSGVTKPASLPA